MLAAVGGDLNSLGCFFLFLFCFPCRNSVLFEGVFLFDQFLIVIDSVKSAFGGSFRLSTRRIIDATYHNNCKTVHRNWNSK